MRALGEHCGCREGKTCILATIISSNVEIYPWVLGARFVLIFKALQMDYCRAWQYLEGGRKKLTIFFKLKMQCSKYVSEGLVCFSNYLVVLFMWCWANNITINNHFSLILPAKHVVNISQCFSISGKFLFLTKNCTLTIPQVPR